MQPVRRAVAFAGVPAVLAVSAILTGCGTGPDMPANCSALWEEAAPFMNMLGEATSSTVPVWGDYRLSDGAYVVYAGDTPGGDACLGLVRGGAVVAYAALPDQPDLLTPLYGYHFPWLGNGGPFDGLVEAAAQPPVVRDWLAVHGIDSAVIVPVHVEGLPFEISLLQHVQVSIHEGFHVHVQTPQWLGPGGNWPDWDLQPDRADVPSCYTADSTVVVAFDDERRSIESLVVALLDGDTSIACRSAIEFSRRREHRYALLDSLAAERPAEVPASCESSEILMELEEGTADYASWSRLFHDGIADRQDLLQRYRAMQNDAYYLTGAMLLHALYLMNPVGFPDVVREIVGSATPREGSIARVLSRRIDSFCQ